MVMLSPRVYREFHLRIHFAKNVRLQMKTRVPRNLFGKPDHKETVQLLEQTLNEERTRFKQRWSVDPLADDDKENGPLAKLTPKKRSSPYAKQTSIHDFWRSRKTYELGKKSPNGCSATPRPAPLQPPARMGPLDLSPTPAEQPRQETPLPSGSPADPADPADPAAPSAARQAEQPLDPRYADAQLDDLQPSTN